MSRRRSEWPEPWKRLKWAPGDITRLSRLLAMTLQPRERTFIDEMLRAPEVTLQQVAYVRSLARRYRADPAPSKKEPPSARRYGDDY